MFQTPHMRSGLKRTRQCGSCVSSPRIESSAGLMVDDSPESFKDAPLSLQVAGPRYEDEKVCKAIEIISKAVCSEQH